MSGTETPTPTEHYRYILAAFIAIYYVGREEPNQSADVKQRPCIT